LIKWEGFPSSENTWEPIENLSCDDLIKEFEEKLRQKQQNRGIMTKSSSAKSVVKAAKDKKKKKKGKASAKSTKSSKKAKSGKKAKGGKTKKKGSKEKLSKKNKEKKRMRPEADKDWVENLKTDVFLAEWALTEYTAEKNADDGVNKWIFKAERKDPNAPERSLHLYFNNTFQIYLNDRRVDFSSLGKHPLFRRRDFINRLQLRDTLYLLSVFKLCPGLAKEPIDEDKIYLSDAEQRSEQCHLLIHPEERRCEKCTCKLAEDSGKNIAALDANLPIWQFFLELLDSGDENHREIIEWLDPKEQYQFRIKDPEELALLWGKKTGRLRCAWDTVNRFINAYSEASNAIWTQIPTCNEEERIYQFLRDPYTLNREDWPRLPNVTNATIVTDATDATATDPSLVQGHDVVAAAPEPEPQPQPQVEHDFAAAVAHPQVQATLQPQQTQPQHQYPPNYHHVMQY